MKMHCKRFVLFTLFFWLAAAWAPAQGPQVRTAPQVVAGPGLGFEFVTVITLQNTRLLPCSAEVLLHRGPGQTVDVDLQVNGADLTNPTALVIPGLAANRLRITTAPGETGLFQGAARITDQCNGLEVTAGFDIVPGASGAIAPAAGAQEPPEIFNYQIVSSNPLFGGVVGRAVVDIDPTGLDGLPNTPGLAIVGDPIDLIFLSFDLCHRVVDQQLQPVTSTFCAPFDGSHFTTNLNQIFPGIPALDNATWEFFLQGPSGEPARADALVIDVTPPNQFRPVPLTTFNPDCDSNALCLTNNRFQVTVGASNGTTLTAGMAVPLDPTSGLFFFPQLGEDNFELLLKIIDGCSFNGHYWVFAASTTNVEYDLTVVDTRSGQTRDYDNILGNPAPPITDTSAFATCP